MSGKEYCRLALVSTSIFSCQKSNMLSVRWIVCSNYSSSFEYTGSLGFQKLFGAPLYFGFVSDYAGGASTLASSSGAFYLDILNKNLNNLKLLFLAKNERI
jgi:hypothetical protein